jgi:hypothetical protein
MHALFTSMALLALGACASGPIGAPLTCASDSECESGQLCFAEGCGDPGKGIVVEVEGNALSGQFARDIPISSGTLGASQNFDLGAPLLLSGEFQRERSTVANPTDRTFYSDPVVVTAVGTSVLLPGIKRVYEGRFSSAERGSFQMRLGAGEFVLTAMPGDRTVPPAVTRASVNPAVTSPSVTFVFPAADSAPALTGQVIKKVDATTAPPERVLISSAYATSGQSVPTVELQLFDLDNTPLSQRFPISGTTGEFAVTVSPEARAKPRLIVVASPRDPGVEIPTKRFVIDTQLSTAITLEYGDFGEAAEVTGTVLDSSGAPVRGAQVSLEGTVVGDGTFRSKAVATDDRGEFHVRSLPSKNEGSFQLSVVPPKESRGAVSRRAVTVKVLKDAATGALTATLTPKVITLEDRLVARGLVLRPGTGLPAVGVSVRATPQADEGTTNSTSVSIESAEAVTDADGAFSFPLDPGVWRFEYVSGEQLPISTRLVTIRAQLDESGNKLPEQVLTPVQLSFGRTVTGLVTGDMGSLLATPLPFAQLRFFRVTTVEGRPSSILLGSTIADERGKYEVVLPTVAASEK